MAKFVIKPLKDITAIMTKGITPKYTEKINLNTVIVLNQKCNRNFTISLEAARFNDCTKKTIPTEKILQPYDVLINSTGTGTAGRVAQLFDVPKPMTIDGHMILLRPTKEIEPIYYGYAIKAHQNEIELLAEGSTGQTEINRKRLGSEIMISFPIDIYEQTKISTFLYKIDQKIQLNQTINDNLADLLQTVYQERFGDASSATTQGILSDICSYSKDKVSVSELDLSTYFSTENMLPEKAGAIEATSLPATPQTTACHKGDTLISNIRPYFKKIVYCQSECGCSTDVLCFTPSKSYYASYLFSTLYADKFFAFMVAGSKGTKMPRGDKQQIMTYPIAIPSDAELDEFNSVTLPILAQIHANHRESKRLSEMRDVLLPKLMSGEIDVSAVQI